MDQESQDYADRDPPSIRLSPAIARLLVAVAVMLALFGLCLLIGVLIDVD